MRFLALFIFKKHPFYGVFKIYFVMLYSPNVALFHYFPSLWHRITYVRNILMVRIVFKLFSMLNSFIRDEYYNIM